MKLYDNTISFVERVQLLTESWQSVTALLTNTTNDACDNVMHLVLRHTLHSMLMTEWMSVDKKDLIFIKERIHECMPLITNSLNSQYRCTYILANFEGPWSNDILVHMMNSTLDDTSKLEEGWCFYSLFSSVVSVSIFT